MNEVRIAGRMLARELKAEEVLDVSGGVTVDYYTNTICDISPDEFMGRNDDCGTG